MTSPTTQFERISRWLYRCGPYSISAVTTSVHGRWRVTRNGQKLGFAGSLDGAKAVVTDDQELEARLAEAQAVYEEQQNKYLTDGHGRAIMVPEARNDERTTSMSENTFNTCQCLSSYTEEDVDGELVRVHYSCGLTIPRKRTFKPGHDAKYKSVLLWAFRANVAFTYERGGVRTSADPMGLALDRGWGHFMTIKPKKASKAKASEGKDNTGVDHADDQPDTEVNGYHPARVKVGRWWKEGHVVSENRGDNTVTVAYQDKKGEHEITLDKDDEKLEIG